ncbi:RNA-binding domain-containing protein [uncultured Sutterella sp.]|uniref:RNA-binding domain-containing protein n=1 Tax=uncultured Sutterella sp. TaxID=286133 RepID=UPI00260948D3|nr:RNA-binding domain-containing protein [uncultured Sutterella sp.]
MKEIPKAESQTVEFKSQWTDGIKKTLVAFANTTGGDLYIGVGDNGEVIGLQNINRVEEQLISMIRDNIAPSIFPFTQFEQLCIDRKHVLWVHVDQGSQRPYAFDGTNAGSIYVRIGNSSRPASIDEVSEMVRTSNPTPWEERISPEQDLSFNSFRSFALERNIDIDPQKHIGLGLWNKKIGLYTNLGLLCSDQNPFEIVCIQFADQDKLEILKSERISGSIFKLFNESFIFLKSATARGMEKAVGNSLNREDHYSVPIPVIREALINLVAHRDFGRTPPCTIHVTPKYVELFSVGGLPDLMPDDIYLRLATNCRNSRLAALLVKLGLMESLGTGFNLIFNTYKKLLPQEIVIISSSSFVLRIPQAPKITSEANSGWRRELIELMNDKEAMSRQEIQDAWQVKQATCINRLRQAADEGLIEIIGNGRSRKYKLNSAVS